MRETNWAGNYVYGARGVHHPTTLDEVRELAAGSERVRVVGSRHSFTGIGDSGELIALDGLPADVTVDRAAGTATVPAGLTYAQVALALEPHGVALHSLASLPHISVGGSNATATHGSGDANGNLVRRTRRPRHPTGRENLDPPAR